VVRCGQLWSVVVISHTHPPIGLPVLLNDVKATVREQSRSVPRHYLPDVDVWDFCKFCVFIILLFCRNSAYYVITVRFLTSLFSGKKVCYGKEYDNVFATFFATVPFDCGRTW